MLLIMLGTIGFEDKRQLRLAAESVWKMFRKLLYEAAKETLVEYLNKTSLNGCRLLYAMRRRKYQRLVWLIFIILTIAFAIYVCSTFLSSFLKDPIVTTKEVQPYTIYEAPFPSVAVCSHNKFSRQMLWNYASKITLHSPAEQNLTYWVKRLEILAGLYNYDSIDFDEAEELQYELESILGEKFVASKILKMLAPSCDDLLVKCFWANQVIDCRKEFEFKMFLDGPCCVFNYQYKKKPDSLYYPNETTVSKELMFVVNSSSDDYFYAENSAIGFYVKIFSTQLIADTRLGGMTEFHVGTAEEVNVRLELISQVTSENTRSFSAHKRHCYFPNEHSTTYDESKCLLTCIARIVMRNCNCLLFYIVNSDIDIELERDEEIVGECSLLSLRCLKLSKYELMDTSDCSYCYPSCSYNLYGYRKSVKRLSTEYQKQLNRNTTLDISLVKIFYPSDIATKYNRNTLYNWHHVLSQIGGVMSICMGCSIINGIEILYFVGYRLMENFFKLRRTRPQTYN